MGGNAYASMQHRSADKLLYIQSPIRRSPARMDNKHEAIIMSEYKLKPGKLGKKIMDAYQGIEDKFVDKFQEEDGSLKTGGMAEKATTAYHKVEDTVVGVYKKVENAFVDAFLEKVDEPESKDSEEKK